MNINNSIKILILAVEFLVLIFAVSVFIDIYKTAIKETEIANTVKSGYVIDKEISGSFFGKTQHYIEIENYELKYRYFPVSAEKYKKIKLNDYYSDEGLSEEEYLIIAKASKYNNKIETSNNKKTTNNTKRKYFILQENN